MAVETVSALTELTSPAANDEIGIWDVSAGEYKKIQQSNLVGATITGGGTVALGGYTLTVPATGTAALVNVAQTYSAALTFDSEINVRGHVADNEWSIDAANESVTLADSATLALSVDSTFSGLVIVTNLTSGSVGMFVCGGGSVVEVADTLGDFSVVKDTGSRTNVFYDAPRYYVQNKLGASRDYTVFSIRTKASS